MADPLQGLRDIHLPPPVHNWPTAPGYFLLVTTILFLFALYLFLRKKNRVKRLALRHLEYLKQQYAQDNSAQQLAIELSRLLKQVALVYYPRDQVVSLQGEEWIIFLTQKSKGLDFNHVRHELTVLPYISETAMTKEQFERLTSMCQRWIQQRSLQCLN